MNAHYLLGDTIMGFTRRPAAFSTTTVSRLGEQHRACGREILRLNSENADLRDELAIERARYEDLSQSAAMWIRLYELQLARANRLATCAADATELPAS